MIIATVRTCPQRWESYRAFCADYARLQFPFPLRTFQTMEAATDACVNSRLTARAALAYCEKHLPDALTSWALFLEDDVLLHKPLPELLHWLVEYGNEQGVDCWYLCNRHNPVARQFRAGGLVLNELGWPMLGSHALLIPKRHLKRMLATRWRRTVDVEMFSAIRRPEWRVLQVIHPVLAEHRGEYSTFLPNHRLKLEINYATC